MLKIALHGGWREIRPMTMFGAMAARWPSECFMPGQFRRSALAEGRAKAKPVKAGDAKPRGYRTRQRAMPVGLPNGPREGVVVGSIVACLPCPAFFAPLGDAPPPSVTGLLSRANKSCSSAAQSKPAERRGRRASGLRRLQRHAGRAASESASRADTGGPSSFCSAPPPVNHVLAVSDPVRERSDPV